MLKKLLFTLALTLVCGIAQVHAQTAQPTPTEPTQPRIPREWTHSDDWKQLVNLPECEAVTASEKMPHIPPHFEGLVTIEKGKALKQLIASLEPLEKRREIVSNLRVQIMDYYGSRSR